MSGSIDRTLPRYPNASNAAMHKVLSTSLMVMISGLTWGCQLIQNQPPVRYVLVNTLF